MIRAKFVVTENIENEGFAGSKVLLEPRYDQNIPEDQSYATATPMGRIELSVNNPAVEAQYVVGQAFYVDFTPVPLVDMDK